MTNDKIIGGAIGSPMGGAIFDLISMLMMNEQRSKYPNSINMSSIPCGLLDIWSNISRLKMDQKA